MASSLPTPAVARSRPVHYYEGMMKKKGRGEALYKKFWAGLLGNALYFYNHHKDAQYVDVISLEDFVSLTDDNSLCKIPTEAKMTLQLKNRTVHLKVDSSEYREMWKGFILTVTELKVPSELALLPGPRHMMHEVLQKELERRTEVEKEYDEAKDEELLPCFHKVSRLEAQELLEKHPDCGNLIIRPSQDSSGVSVTTCQKCKGVNVIRHYRVRHNRGMYVIEVDQAVTCKSLIEVMKYFVEKTNKALTPFIMQTDYEQTLNFIPINEENGESIIRHPGSFRGSSPPDPRGATRLRHGNLQPPPIPSGPPPEDEDEDDDQLYMNDDVVASARNTSLCTQEAWTIPRAQPVAPRNPTSQPVAPRKSTSLTDHTDAPCPGSGSPIDSRGGTDAVRTLPRLPRQVPTPRERDSAARSSTDERLSGGPQPPAARQRVIPPQSQIDAVERRSSEGKTSVVPPRPAARQRCIPPKGDIAGIDDELKQALRLRFNQC